MKITIILAVAALLALAFVCLVAVVSQHNKAPIQTARAKHYRARLKNLNLWERLARPFVRAMELLQHRTQRWFAPSRLAACNIAEGTHECSVTKLSAAAIATRHLLFVRGADDNHVTLAGASDALAPMGTVDDEASAAEEPIAVQILGKGPTKRMIASETMTVGDEVWTAASGKVQDRTATPGTYWIVGTALTAAGADEIIEVADCTPIRITVT
jgi:hypothetical protein